MADSACTERKKYIIRQIVEILGIGLGYLIFSGITGIFIPCPIKLITGYKCPGCGVTHYVLALLHGNVNKAYEANRLLFFLMPLLVIYGIYRVVTYIRNGRTGFNTVETVLLSLVFLATIGFGVYRNILNI